MNVHIVMFSFFTPSISILPRRYGRLNSVASAKPVSRGNVKKKTKQNKTKQKTRQNKNTQKKTLFFFILAFSLRFFHFHPIFPDFCHIPNSLHTCLIFPQFSGQSALWPTCAGYTTVKIRSSCAPAGILCFMVSWSTCAINIALALHFLKLEIG